MFFRFPVPKLQKLGLQTWSFWRPDTGDSATQSWRLWGWQGSVPLRLEKQGKCQQNREVLLKVRKKNSREWEVPKIRRHSNKSLGRGLILLGKALQSQSCANLTVALEYENLRAANNKSFPKNNMRLCQQVLTCTWLTVSLRNSLAAISRKSANSCLCWNIPGTRGRWCHRCHRCHRCPCPFLGGCLSSTWVPHLFQRLHDFLKLSVHALAHQWGSALEKTTKGHNFQGLATHILMARSSVRSFKPTCFAGKITLNLGLWVETCWNNITSTPWPTWFAHPSRLHMHTAEMSILPCLFPKKS